jgi:hypothetical protein
VTDPTSHVLQAIDNAVQDFELSADAMRWAPGGAAVASPAQALQRPETQWQDRPRVSEPLRWEQRKTTCTLAEIDAWLAEEANLIHHSPYAAIVDALPPTSITMHRQHPPCVGCGRPTGTPFSNALTVEGMNGPSMTATFQPCGCQLAVSVPALLEDVPLGTRPERYAGQVIAGEVFEQGYGDRVVERVKAQIIQVNDERPHVVMVLNDDDPLLERVDSVLRRRMMPGDKAVIALWLEAISGGTDYIVYRPASDMPDEYMPPGLVSRWEPRPSAPIVALPVSRDGFMSSVSMAIARGTGRIEISPEGAVAEVYEVRADHLP